MGNTPYTVHHWATGNQYVVIWASMSSSNGSLDVGAMFPSATELALGAGLFSDKSVQVIRSAGSDVQVLIEGSNQATLSAAATTSFTFASLSDPQGNGLMLPPSGNPVQNSWIEAILENSVYIRPRVATTSFPGTNPATVYLFVSSVRGSRSGV